MYLAFVGKVDLHRDNPIEKCNGKWLPEKVDIRSKPGEIEH